MLRGETLEPKEVRDVNSGDVFEICGRLFRFEAAVAPAPVPAPAPQQAVDVDLTGAPGSDEEEVVDLDSHREEDTDDESVTLSLFKPIALAANGWGPWGCCGAPLRVTRACSERTPQRP